MNEISKYNFKKSSLLYCIKHWLLSFALAFIMFALLEEDYLKAIEVMFTIWKVSIGPLTLIILLTILYRNNNEFKVLHYILAFVIIFGVFGGFIKSFNMHISLQLSILISSLMLNYKSVKDVFITKPS